MVRCILFFYFMIGVLGDVVFVSDLFYGKILYSPLTTADVSTVPLRIENQTSPADIEFDPFENRLYWTDSYRGTLESASLDDHDQKIVLSGLQQPHGFALDLVVGNMYWVNRGNLSILVSKLNGQYPKVLFSDLSSPPFDIALDTSRG